MLQPFLWMFRKLLELGRTMQALKCYFRRFSWPDIYRNLSFGVKLCRHQWYSSLIQILWTTHKKSFYDINRSRILPPYIPRIFVLQTNFDASFFSSNLFENKYNLEIMKPSDEQTQRKQIIWVRNESFTFWPLNRN